MKILIEAASQNLSPYLETLYDYQFVETEADEQRIVEGYIVLDNFEALSAFMSAMNKHFKREKSQFVLTTSESNEMHLLIYDDWIE